MLLVASYVFYGWWNWRFLFLMLASTVLDYYCCLGIHGSTKVRERKFYLFLSIFVNLGFLCYFKYFNFFISSLGMALGYLGLTIHPMALHIILPLGISFYTFQTLSYTIDVYRRQLAPTRNFVDFALFVSFSPQLFAGPIERAVHLLPQIALPRNVTPEKLGRGCYLIFWGLFQKMFVADNPALMRDRLCPT